MRIFLLALFFSQLTTAWAQTGGQLVALVADTDRNAIPFANAALFSLSDSSLVTGAVTNMEGRIALDVPAGRYFLRVSFLSYKEKIVSPIVVANKTVDLGTVLMEENAAVLDEVIVQGEKTQMELQLDKRVFNVEKDLSNIGRNAAEILDNVPSVTVDVDGSVSLRGSENVRILINGKPSGLTGISNPEALRQLQGNMIESIEVITNPSSRFDAEGEVGIINIILKKESRRGVTGSLNATTGYPANHGAAANLTFREEKFSINTSYGFNYRSGPGSGNSFQEYTSADTSFVYEQDQKRLRSGSSHNVMLGGDFFITDKSSINASAVYRRSDGINTSTITYRDLDANRILQDTQIRTEREEEPENNLDLSLGYRKEFNKPGQLLTIDLKHISSEELELADYWQGDEAGNPLVEQRADNLENELNQLAQIDYIHPFGKDGKVEAGAKSATRIIQNDFLLEEKSESGEWAILPTFNNNLIYTETIHALYGMVGNKVDKFSYQLGLRGEYSDIKTELTETNEENEQLYFNLFPSTHFSYQLSDLRSVQLSYSYRISRPRMRDLAPFSNFSDARVFNTGNPNLRPEYTHSIEGGYLLNWDKGSLLASGYYRYRLGVIQRINLVGSDGLTRILPVNLATEHAQGLEFNLSLQPTDWWRLNTNANFFRAVTEGEYQDERLFSDTYTWNGRMASRLTLFKNIDFQQSVNYRAPRITPQGRDRSLYAIDLGLSRNFLKGRATATASVRDLLNSRKRRSIIDRDGYYSESEFQWRARQFLLNFSYRINQKNDARSRDRGDDDDDFDGDF